MAQIRMKAPENGKIYDTRTGQEHTEVICDERNQHYFVVIENEEKK